jgi:hypothetical protein
VTVGAGPRPATTWSLRTGGGAGQWHLRRPEASRDRTGAVAALLATLERDVDVLAQPQHGWQDFLQRLAHGLCRAAQAHPEAVPVLLTQTPARWLLPPLATPVWAERVLAGLSSEGFTDEDAVAAYHAFTTFLAGQVWRQWSAARALPGAATDDAWLAAYPSLRRLRGVLSRDLSVTELEDGLEELLERLRTMRAPTTRWGRLAVRGPLDTPPAPSGRRPVADVDPLLGPCLPTRVGTVRQHREVAES